jgi:hypothetical protein
VVAGTTNNLIINGGFDSPSIIASSQNPSVFTNSVSNWIMDEQM